MRISDWSSDVCTSDLVCDSPLPEPLDDLKLKGIPPEPLKAFLADQGCSSLLTKLGGDIPPPPAAPEPSEADDPPFNHDDYVCVTDEATLESWIAEAFAEGVIAVGTEPDSDDDTRSALVGVRLANGTGRDCNIHI